MQIAFARWGGAKGYGAYSMGLSAAQLANIVEDGGLGRGAIRFLPGYRTNGDQAHVNGYVLFAVTFTVLFGAALSSIAAVLLFAFDTPSSERTALMVGFATSVPLALSNLGYELGRGARQVTRSYISLLVIVPSVSFVAAAAMHIAGVKMTGTALLLASAVGFCASASYSLAVVARSLKVRPQPTARNIRRWFRVSVPLLTVTGLFTALPMIGILLVGFIRGAEEAGYYAAAYRAAQFVGLAFTAVDGRTSPAISTLHTNRRKTELRQLIMRTRRWTFWPSLIISVVAGLASGLILSMLGPEFTSARDAFLLLLVAQVITGFSGALGSYFSYTGQHRRVARVTIACTLFGVVVSTVCIPLFGATGAALGYIAFVLSWNAYLVAWGRRELALRWLPA
jgi:O-antigen/teichoic acid export membrane protein